MVGINKGPIVLDLETVFIQARAGVLPCPIGKGRIVGVVFQNRLNDIGGGGNNVEIMIGFGTAQIWQMLPGQESPVIYANDLEDIYIRVRTGVTEVDVPVIVYRQRQDKKEG